jgi:hypothetical protein
MAIQHQWEFFRDLRRHPERFYVIHYSCQSLYDDNEALSPRITSIAVAHYSTEQTISFSTHAIAEELHIPREQVIARFDEVEVELLRRFYDFVRERRDKYWIHWNMRNLTFGFEHLEHRYRVLGRNDASVIPIDQRINLSDMLSERFGAKYAPHPKMINLMKQNGGIHRHFLDGEQEVQAFQSHEFIKMHNSTLAKVGFFHYVVKQVLRGKLRVASRSVGVLVDRLFESRTAKMIGLVSAIITIAVILPAAYKFAKALVPLPAAPAQQSAKHREVPPASARRPPPVRSDLSKAD